MKDSLLSITLLAGVLIGASACQSPSEKPSEAASTRPVLSASDSTAGGMRVAYVNIDSLVEGYEYHKGLRAQLENQVKALENELMRKGQVLQENAQILEQQASRLSEGELRQAQQELLGKQQEAMEYRDAQSRRIAEEEEKLTALLKEDMKSVIDSLRVYKKLDFILSYGDGGPILSAEPSLDITKEVLEQLNAANRNRNQKKDAKK
ncbi:hypothetical protein GC167_10725 [bacterium]|nr:hypothetical protein [bacterium]